MIYVRGVFSSLLDFDPVLIKKILLEIVIAPSSLFNVINHFSNLVFPGALIFLQNRFFC